jgi:hypothetical protein
LDKNSFESNDWNFSSIFWNIAASLMGLEPACKGVLSLSFKDYVLIVSPVSYIISKAEFCYRNGGN